LGRRAGKPEVGGSGKEGDYLLSDERVSNLLFMRMTLLTLVFIVSVTATAQARLGETADQLVARYGQPLSEVDQKGEGDKVALANVVFQKGGFEIDVSLDDGLSVSETFKKLDGAPLTLGEVRTLLSNNAQGYGWEAPQIIEGQKWWTRDDNATAHLVRDGVILTIKSRELASKEAVAKRLEHEPSLEGF
jgi:hypothetical protein